jgi:hypothetical protein
MLATSESIVAASAGDECGADGEMRICGGK